ncbi:MAG: hypothetical protein J6Z11_14075 [Candidatus Riflebacteria bacterium]|nr:hypothetical protein [Candidatus Riflebacteria bacterium]
MNRRGFSIYLTFLVTTVVFILVAGSQEISVTALDLSRSDAIDVIVFHAADGGLEKGLGKIRKKFDSFKYTYVSELKPNRTIKVTLNATKEKSLMNLYSEAILFEGNKEVSRRTVSRLGIAKNKGRDGLGKFTEAI